MSLSPIFDLNEWCDRYGISLRNPVECCGVVLPWVKAMAMKGYRGIHTEPCDQCGNRPFRVVPIDEYPISVWNSIKGEL